MKKRPLTPLSNEMEALTPGHFLVGEPPQRTIQENISLANRWRLLQKISQDFWKTWSSDYLKQLQQRRKWQTTTPNISVNDIVILKEVNMPPKGWRERDFSWKRWENKSGHSSVQK